MALTEAQKRKIREEEELRAQIRNELTQPEKKKTSGFTKFVTALLIIFIVIPFGLLVLFGSLLMGSSSSSTSTEPTIDTSELTGNVNFDGYMFHVRNDETKDWTKCWITINKKYNYPSNAPSTTLDIIAAGETIDIAPSYFTLKDGTRFNPYATQPQNVSIDCNGRFGYWQWN